MSRYILAVDQSTQGTKGLLFDDQGVLVGRADRPHRQIVNDQGWISHDPAEIRKNTLEVCKDVIEKVGAKTGICKGDIVALGISNQRETTVAWNRKTGEPLCDAIVWQCARAAQLCEQHSDLSETVQ